MGALNPLYIPDQEQVLSLLRPPFDISCPV